jgi:hypothetical protein
MIKRFIPIAAVLMLAGATARAQQLDFQFTFVGDNTSDDSPAETVTGTLYGLDDNSTSLPTSVEITSAPSDIPVSIPYIFSAAAIAAESGTGFTVTNGVITDAVLYIQDGTGPGVPALSLNDGLNLFGTSDGGNGYMTYTYNDDGFGGATYAQAVPEPGLGWLLLLGAGAIWSVKRFQSRTQPS